MQRSLSLGARGSQAASAAQIKGLISAPLTPRAVSSGSGLMGSALQGLDWARQETETPTGVARPPYCGTLGAPPLAHCQTIWVELILGHLITPRSRGDGGVRLL